MIASTMTRMKHATSRRSITPREMDDLALAERGTQQTDSHERTAQQDQADERAEESAAIQITHGFRHIGHYEIMHEARQQTNQDQSPCRKILTEHDTRERDGLGTNKVPYTALSLF